MFLIKTNKVEKLFILNKFQIILIIIHSYFIKHKMSGILTVRIERAEITRETDTFAKMVVYFLPIISPFFYCFFPYYHI